MEIDGNVDKLLKTILSCYSRKVSYIPNARKWTTSSEPVGSAFRQFIADDFKWIGEFECSITGAYRMIEGLGMCIDKKTKRPIYIMLKGSSSITIYPSDSSTIYNKVLYIDDTKSDKPHFVTYDAFEGDIHIFHDNNMIFSRSKFGTVNRGKISHLLLHEFILQMKCPGADYIPNIPAEISVKQKYQNCDEIKRSEQPNSIISIIWLKYSQYHTGKKPDPLRETEIGTKCKNCGNNVGDDIYKLCPHVEFCHTCIREHLNDTNGVCPLNAEHKDIYYTHIRSKRRIIEFLSYRQQQKKIASFMRQNPDLARSSNDELLKLLEKTYDPHAIDRRDRQKKRRILSDELYQKKMSGEFKEDFNKPYTDVYGVKRLPDIKLDALSNIDKEKRIRTESHIGYIDTDGESIEVSIDSMHHFVDTDLNHKFVPMYLPAARYTRTEKKTEGIVNETVNRFVKPINYLKTPTTQEIDDISQLINCMAMVVIDTKSDEVKNETDSNDYVIVDVAEDMDDQTEKDISRQVNAMFTDRDEIDKVLISIGLVQHASNTSASDSTLVTISQQSIVV